MRFLALSLHPTWSKLESGTTDGGVEGHCVYVRPSLFWSSAMWRCVGEVNCLLLESGRKRPWRGVELTKKRGDAKQGRR